MSNDKPEKMSAAELTNARTHYKIREGLGPISQTEVLVPRLLRHIAALESERAPAPVDREALGRIVLKMDQDIEDDRLDHAWSVCHPETREDYMAIGEALHTIGARSRDAEVAALSAELIAHRTSANAVIDGLEARVRAFQRATGEADFETVTPEMVERIAAERDEARSLRAEDDTAWRASSGAASPGELSDFIARDLQRAGVERDAARAEGEAAGREAERRAWQSATGADTAAELAAAVEAHRARWIRQ